MDANIRVRGPSPEHSGPPEAWNPGSRLQPEGFTQGKRLSSQSPGPPKPATILPIVSGQETQSLSASMETAEPRILTVDLSERRGRLPDPTGSLGRPRSPPRPGSLPAGQGRPLGVPEQPAPHSARARTPLPGRGFGPPSPRQAAARRGLTLPQRLVTLGGVGDGTAGRGRGREPGGGKGSCSRGKYPRRREDPGGEGKTPPAARGEGREAGLRQEGKTRRGSSRETHELSRNGAWVT